MKQRTIDVEKAIKAQSDYLIERSKTDNTWMRDSFAKGEGFFVYMFGMLHEIKYVHQLQNILTIAGIEIEFKI